VERGDAAGLAAALARNVRPGEAGWAQAPELADYVLVTYRRLASHPVAEIVAGELAFPAAAPA
jgi:cytochrome b pre-mRNA-processing protein 3